MINKNGTNKIKDVRSFSFIVLLAFAEIILLVLILSLFPGSVLAGIGQNVTVVTQLTIGNVNPEVLNVTLNNFTTNGIDLIANDTQVVTLYAIVRDYNGEADINLSYATLFDRAASSYAAANDNNNHYTNNSCEIDYTYGSGADAAYLANVTCKFYLWYYANNASWNGTIIVNDTYSYSAMNSNTVTVNSLLSLGLPAVLDYGTVNATFVSEEKTLNVTNFGNVMTNITLEGYAVTRYDNYSMNCTLGANKNISIFYEKYNLTASNNSALTYAQFDSIYVNLTSAPVAKRINANYRQNDVTNDAINATYWRMYVPSGVAGSCAGNIIFSAIRTQGT